VPAASALRNPVVYYAAPGTYQAILTVTDGNGQSDSDTLAVTVQAFVPPTAVQADFESGFPPAGITIDNPNNDAQWSLCSTAGGYGSSPNSAYFRNYVYDVTGTADDLRVHFDASAALSGPLTFDVAHAVYGGQYTDTLEVLASTDCGASFALLYKKWGADLATAPNNTNEFFPAASEWRTDSIDLSAFSGAPHLVVAFRNKGAWGNNVFIDNIRIQTSGIGLQESAPAQFRVYPNPVSAKGALTVVNPLGEPVQARLINGQGQVVLQQLLGASGMLDLRPANLPAGVYFLNLKGETRMENHRLVVY
jgi:hypothetical protein